MSIEKAFWQQVNDIRANKMRSYWTTVNAAKPTVAFLETALVGCNLAYLNQSWFLEGVEDNEETD